MPALVDALTTARMTAFRPGASPPPVRTPIFFILGISVGRRSLARPGKIEYSRWISRRAEVEPKRQKRREMNGYAGSLRVNRERRLVDGARLELATSALRTRRSPN